MISNDDIFIEDCELVSPGGSSLAQNFDLLASTTEPRLKFDLNCAALVGRADGIENHFISELSELDKKWARVDRSTLLAAWVAKQLRQRRFFPESTPLIASSGRGALETLEKSHQQFLSNGDVPFLTSPLTTIGQLASVLANLLNLDDLACVVSSSCTGGLSACQVAYSQLQGSRDTQRSLVVCSEAAITRFMLAQLKAVGVYLKSTNPNSYQPLGKNPKGMVLSESAVAILLKKGRDPELRPKARVLGLGFASERHSLTGLSENGLALQQAIYKALKQADLGVQEINLVVAHGSGTPKGDAAELNAFLKVFNGKIPAITSFKWFLGHSLGAATAVSITLASEMLAKQKYLALPYQLSDVVSASMNSQEPTNLNHILICGLGFGGQAGAIILGKI